MSCINIFVQLSAGNSGCILEFSGIRTADKSQVTD